MCAVRLTGQADFYGPSYGVRKAAPARLSATPFDRSVYMPEGVTSLSQGEPASMALLPA